MDIEDAIKTEGMVFEENEAECLNGVCGV